jgi:hypothetical protein
MAIQFNERVTIGSVGDNEPITETFKAWATMDLIRRVQSGTIVFSEIDAEGVSQLERIARQRRASGHMHYFVVSTKGHGESSDDHIYASYLCFIGALREPVVSKSMALARAYTKTTER